MKKVPASKIPATVITGFLGAGKTTLIRHLIENAGGRRLALIINEFGDVGVDGALVQGCGDEACPDEDIIELANGCICCTVADDFLPTMQKLLDRPTPPDHIIIETSGLALPKPLVKAFQWPDIRTRATVDGVITLIDADALAAGRFAHDEVALAAARAADPTLDHDSPIEELFEDQLACADLVLLNKTDLVDAATLAGLERDLARETRPGVSIIRTSEGEIDPAVLLGLDSGVEDQIDARPSHHDNEEEHDHDDFESFIINLGELGTPEPLLAALADAIATHDLLRVKGFLAIAGRPARLVVQAVGPRIQHHYDRQWQPGEQRSSRLVVIGQTGLDCAAIETTLKVQTVPA
ncbi:cobalamin biosynthesis protein CobW [Sphingobium sp. TB-6]|uniref:cobalamin biosynthesis protein CobW n=1 Tax=Sphingobium sp. TB-6 TaxID=2728850 RepID=UPI00146DD8E8|nr:cobalamin biosynthesis protein CobW [Sphingobium sp. TB-6]NML90948.1 cobalamin biosynthesis protein CobW [Sphingobium sp. TB-6]